MVVDLKELAEKINAAYGTHKKTIRVGLSQARFIGGMLLQVKTALRHGSISQWVESNCKFGYSMASLYMRVAKHWDTIVEYQLANSEKRLSFKQAATKVIRHRNDRPTTSVRSKKECEQQILSLANMAAKASPGDVCEMCLELVRAAEDPAAVAVKLIPELEVIKTQKRRQSLSEVLSQ
jgi:hypothetical protein